MRRPAAAAGNGHGGGNGNDHGRSDGPGGGRGDRGGFGGWSDRGGGRGTEGRGGSGGPDGSARGTPTAPADLPESSLATAAAPAADDHGDAADRLRLFELLGEQPGALPPGIDATPAGPDLTHRQERALIAKGWRGTP